MRRNKRRYLAMAVLSDKRSIKASYSMDGGKLRYDKAARLAMARFKDILDARKGMVGALYEAAAFADERKVVFSSEDDGSDPNTLSHESVHVDVDLKRLRQDWQRTLPLEESVAYAYGDYIALNAGERFTLPREVREREFLSKHSMRVMQCIGYDDRRPGIFGSSLRMLYKSAEDGNKNLAWALDVAANYLFYRECFQLLSEHGAKGLGMLFQALRLAADDGLKRGWEHIIANISAESVHRIIGEAKLRGRPLLIRSPYAHDCLNEELRLDE